MAMKVDSGRVFAPDCTMCRAAESRVRVVITDPLVESLTSWLCPDCYPIFMRAVASLVASDRSLVVSEVAA